nr:MAG TPA: hypothetical protein [Caudoviricetes sp.]
MAILLTDRTGTQKAAANRGPNLRPATATKEFWRRYNPLRTTARPRGNEGKQNAPATACNSDRGKKNPRSTTNQGNPIIHGAALHDKEEKQMISITIYLDGKTSECGYKYVVQRDCMAWTAYRTDSGFRRFLALYGLKINPQFTQLHDMQAVGKGRVITTACYDKRVTDGRYFWSLDEVPENARRFVSLCNGEYVDCYITDDGQTATVYRPNPNAKNVYIPYNYREMDDKIG